MAIPRSLPRLIVLVAAALLVMAFAPPAQAPIITMSVDAGFDGHFRDAEWMPVIVEVSNAGDPMQGRLVIRPETSGSGISNTFSAPVNLPTGASQTVTLYVTARSFATQVRVELIDDSGGVIAATPATIRAVQALDQLYVVITQSTAGSVDMTGASLGGYTAYQTNWRVRDLPDNAAALHAVNMLLFSDVDTSTITSAQKEALSDWVMAGGHLIVTGGPGWQPTAAGIADLLPLEPAGSATLDALNEIGQWLGSTAGRELTAQTVAATGTLREGADVMLKQGELPLLARRSLGGGLVDYLTVDPNTLPLRGWGGLTDLWRTLATTAGTPPTWAYGFSSWDLAADAIEILPGYNLLPQGLPLCGFLALYILLIGPLNYAVLARLNRRELAWVTIPLFIVIFSALAWALGFNLRGTTATLSRLSVVQSWPDSERASVNGLVGLLSPRRAQYDLTLAEGSTLRPIPHVAQGNLITSNVQSSVEVQQTDRFKANDFAVDASFIAGFNTSGIIQKPAIGGSASMSYEGEEGQQRVRGSVRNDSDQLVNPVVLARGMAFALPATLEPGDTEPFEFLLEADGPPAPGLYSPAASTAYGGYSSPYYYSYYGLAGAGQTVVDIMGQDDYTNSDPDNPSSQESRRRRMFLASFMSDYYTYSSSINTSGASTGRGDKVYLAGWTSSAPQPVELEGATWNSEDTTIYLIELAVELAKPTTPVTISPDRFTWLVEERSGIADISPLNLALQPGDQATFRFTPLPTAVLSDVDRLTIRVERPNIGTTNLPISVYNWSTSAWEEVQIRNGSRQIHNPTRFLGPQNSVLVRLNADSAGGYLRVDRLTIEQRGSF
jgi:hypothetical protein